MWLKGLKGGKHVQNVGVDRRIILQATAALKCLKNMFFKYFIG
jgi:hypothetical protein